jgi:hypothetical protein
MRTSVIAGIIIAALGAVLLFRGMSYNTSHDVVRVGDVHVTDTDRHGIPQWVGIVAVVGGVVLIGAGAMKRS